MEVIKLLLSFRSVADHNVELPDLKSRSRRENSYSLKCWGLGPHGCHGKDVLWTLVGRSLLLPLGSASSQSAWAENADEWDELFWRRYFLGVIHVPLQPSLSTFSSVAPCARGSSWHKVSNQPASSHSGGQEQCIISQAQEGDFSIAASQCYQPFPFCCLNTHSVVTHKHTQDPSDKFSNSTKEEKN